MSINFYPHDEDLEGSRPEAKIELLMAAAERYKAVVLEIAAKAQPNVDPKKPMVPHEIAHAYNWDEVARFLRELHDMPEQSLTARLTKANLLAKLSEVYEVLRGAKMPKLEAVRLALLNESNQLRAGGGT
jgi:hypothetical protein